MPGRGWQAVRPCVRDPRRGHRRRAGILRARRCGQRSSNAGPEHHRFGSARTPHGTRFQGKRCAVLRWRWRGDRSGRHPQCGHGSASECDSLRDRRGVALGSRSRALERSPVPRQLCVIDGRKRHPSPAAAGSLWHQAPVHRLFAAERASVPRSSQPLATLPPGRVLTIEVAEDRVQIGHLGL